MLCLCHNHLPAVETPMPPNVCLRGSAHSLCALFALLRALVTKRYLEANFFTQVRYLSTAVFGTFFLQIFYSQPSIHSQNNTSPSTICFLSFYKKYSCEQRNCTGLVNVHVLEAEVHVPEVGHTTQTQLKHEHLIIICVWRWGVCVWGRTNTSSSPEPQTQTSSVHSIRVRSTF